MSLTASAARVAAKTRARDPRRRVKAAAATWRERREANLKADGIVIPLSEWLGHNNGPPLDQDLVYLRWAWAQALGKAWAPPTPEVGLRWARKAAELGMDYRAYVIEILERGHYPQADDLIETDVTHGLA